MRRKVWEIVELGLWISVVLGFVIWLGTMSSHRPVKSEEYDFYEAMLADQVLAREVARNIELTGSDYEQFYWE